MDNKFAEHVKTILTSGNLVNPHVEMYPDGYRWVASVVSETFEDLDEAERQALIWDLLEQNLSVEDHRRVEYVSTRSPREAQAIAA